MKKNKSIVFFLLFVLLASQLKAQNIVNRFVDMPVYLLPTFDKTLKLELIENFNTNPERDTVNNLFGGSARLVRLDTVANNLVIQSTPVSRVEFQLIERKDKSKVLAIINTVCAPICSSYINFYDSEWKELKLDFPKFSIENWLKKSNSAEQKKLAKDLIQINFLEYTFKTDGKILLVSNRSEENLSVEDRKRLSSIVDFEKKQEVNLTEFIN